MNINQLGEFNLINIIKNKVGAESCCPHSSIIESIGDDCAVFKLGEKTSPLHQSSYGLLTTDCLVENVHFKLDYFSPQDLGYKSLVVNISDIAAMAGTPKYALVSIAIPEKLDVEFIEKLYIGIREAADEYSVNIIGGDTSKSPNSLFINISLFGKTTKELLTLRNGAKPGDNIFVTGKLGGSMAGLELLRGASNSTYQLPATSYQLIKKHLRPKARVREAILASKNGASAMIDISDGLVADLGHICEKSEVGALVHSEKVRNDEMLHYTLSGGEDYELIITCPPGKVPNLTNAFQIEKLPLYEIGEIVEGSKVKVIDEDGKEIITKRGFDHFEK